MILTPFALGDAFSRIYWLFINQFRNEIYQMKAEYVNYAMVLLILLVIKYLKKYVLNGTKISIFCNNIFERRQLS